MYFFISEKKEGIGKVTFPTAEKRVRVAESGSWLGCSMAQEV
jgi:hypothetical protein